MCTFWRDIHVLQLTYAYFVSSLLTYLSDRLFCIFILFQLMYITDTVCQDASTAPLISVTWCILTTIISINTYSYSLTALWGGLWGLMSMVRTSRSSGTIAPLCMKKELLWAGSAKVMLNSLITGSAINQVSGTKLFSHFYCQHVEHMLVK